MPIPSDFLSIPRIGEVQSEGITKLKIIISVSCCIFILLQKNKKLTWEPTAFYLTSHWYNLILTQRQGSLTLKIWLLLYGASEMITFLDLLTRRIWNGETVKWLRLHTQEMSQSLWLRVTARRKIRKLTDNGASAILRLSTKTSVSLWCSVYWVKYLLLSTDVLSQVFIYCFLRKMLGAKHHVKTNTLYACHQTCWRDF